MCGIFGYIGKQNSVEVVLSGLKSLEYRGYDSAGIAGLKDGQLLFCKEVGKVSLLQKEVEDKGLSLDTAIAHTRWATHGKPSIANAHPQFDEGFSLAIVHNGIIENYESLRQMLMEKGVNFRSETDTEVVAHLIASLYTGNILKAVQQVVPLLKGAFAIAIIHRDFPDQIIAVAHESPLVIGIGKDEVFLSSDYRAFVDHTKEVVFLSNAEIALISPTKLDIFDSSLMQINKESELLMIEAEECSKKGYPHYTLKEIHEQPQSIRNALLSRYIEELGTVLFEEWNFDVDELMQIDRILITACGTSYHAGCVASYMIEEMARLPVQVEISSEFRYKNPIVQTGTLAIAISQSGETADTIAAVRELKAKGAKVLGICNVQGSMLVREADASIFLKAGPEIGVCSTKAFTSQVVVLALLTMLLARMRDMGKKEAQSFIQELKVLPEKVQKVLNHAEHIHKIAKKYCKYENFFFLGRQYMFPTALEGALKLKEISYVNANGYPAGEMKHGPIALINKDCPTVALCTNKLTYEKMLNNLNEVKARHGKIIAIAEEGSEGLKKLADDIIWVPPVIDPLAAITATAATQLFAYYVALERGEDIDQPRNLAKSVTVE